MENAPTIKKTASRHWLLFILGVLLFVAGPVAFSIQMNMHRLMMPWYIPILATAGVLLMLLSVVRRWGLVRIALLILFVLACGFEWVALMKSSTPKYVGPAQPGHRLPDFSASLADGRPITTKDFEQGKPTALLFFRGHW